MERLYLTGKMSEIINRVAESRGIHPHQLLRSILVGYLQRYHLMPENLGMIEVSADMGTQLQRIAEHGRMSIPQLLSKMIICYQARQKSQRDAGGLPATYTAPAPYAPEPESPGPGQDGWQ